MRKMKIFISLFIYIIFILAALPAAAQDNGENGDGDYEKYRLAAPVFDQGKQLFLEGQGEQAKAIFLQCISLFPAHAEANFYLARIHFDKEEYPTALRYIQTAETHTPILARFLERAQQDHAEKLNAQKAQLQEELYNASEQETVDRLKKDIKVIDQWLQQPVAGIGLLNIRMNYLHGSIMFHMKRYTEARDLLRKVVDKNPKYKEALKHLIISHFMVREFDAALSAIDLSERELQAGYPALKKMIKEIMESSSNMFDLFQELVAPEDPAQDGPQSASEIHKFISLYTRFAHRQRLLNAETLFLMYHHFDDFNVAIDYIEKIPFRDPAVAARMLRRAMAIEKTSAPDRDLYNAVFQGMLEIIAHAARYAPEKYDCDALVSKLIDIPLNRARLYDGVFRILRNDLGIRIGRKNLADIALAGIQNRTVSLNGENYIFAVKPTYRKMIDEIMESQGICSLDTLLRINRLLGRIETTHGDVVQAGALAGQLRDLVRQLPVAEISSEAPKNIRDRINVYSRNKLDQGVGSLVTAVSKGMSANQLRGFIIILKRDYLVHQLKDHLVGLAYALNAKSTKLKVFLNPNMVRLHDFSKGKERTAWSHSGTPPAIETLAAYHFSGGLSRMHLAFAFKWHEQVFSRSYIYNAAHTRAFVTNVMDMYPLPGVDKSLAYNALLVDFGLKLMNKAKEDPAVKKDVTTVFQTLLAGNHYRKAMNYLAGKRKEHGLYFSELLRLGETFFKQNRYLDTCGLKTQLEPFTKSPLQDAVQEEDDRFGGIFYNSFGSLTARRLPLFPPDLSHTFQYGWVSGEMVDEFKARLSWHMYHEKVPPVLMGHILYDYITRTMPRTYSQNHPRDYYSTNFCFEIFNNAIMRRIIKNMQKDGVLRLK